MELALFTTSFTHQYFQQTQLLWISLVVYQIRLHMDITRSWNQIDYILCSQRWRSSIQSTKTRLEADCGSYHELLIAKFRLTLKKVGKTTRPFWYDLNQIPYDYTVEVTNRFKGLDLIDIALKNDGWRFMTLYRRQWSRPSPRKKKCKKTKWLSKEALQIAVKRGEAKGKGEKGKIHSFEWRVPKNSKER